MNKRSTVFTALAVVVLGIAALGACLFLSTGRVPSFFSGPPPFPTATPGPPPPTSMLVARLAHGVPCSPPCWEGLTPGVSTLNDARRAAERLRQTEQVTYAECEATGCTIIEQDETEVTVFVGDDGEVGFIWGRAGGRYPYVKELDLDVQQLVALIGEPSWVILYDPSPFFSCTCDIVHSLPPYVAYPDVLPSVNLLYFEQGVSFYFPIASEDFGCICPDMKLAGFQYFPPVSSLAEYENIGTEYPRYMNQIEEYRLVPWHGFGPGYATANP